MSDVPSSVISDWGILIVSSIGIFSAEVVRRLFNGLQVKDAKLEKKIEELNIKFENEDKNIRQELKECSREVRNELTGLEKELGTELKELRDEMVALITTYNKEVLDGINDVRDTMMPTKDCEHRQAELNMLLAHKGELETKEHTLISESINALSLAQSGMAASIEQIASCLHDLKNNIPCKDDK